MQQHLMKYKRSYRYDPVFALGFVTIYDKLMEGYPSDEDRDAIFQAYIKALKEDPEQYRLEHSVIIVFICFFYSCSKSLAEMKAPYYQCHFNKLHLRLIFF